MKASRLFVAATIMALATVVSAQQKEHHPQPTAQPTESQMAFTKLKTLEGAWEGTITTDPPEPMVQGKSAQVSFRVASRGNVLMHDLRVEGIPDNPLTMFYRDGDGLQLTHYCDAGNRPRMNGKVSPDGNFAEFHFLDLAGSNQHGHMHGAKINFIDQDRHSEDWTWMKPDDKPIKVHFELRRKK